MNEVHFWFKELEELGADLELSFEPKGWHQRIKLETQSSILLSHTCQGHCHKVLWGSDQATSHPGLISQAYKINSQAKFPSRMSNNKLVKAG